MQIKVSSFKSTAMMEPPGLLRAKTPSEHKVLLQVWFFYRFLFAFA